MCRTAAYVNDGTLPPSGSRCAQDVGFPAQPQVSPLVPATAAGPGPSAPLR